MFFLKTPAGVEMHFEFALPSRIVFGAGVSKDIGPRAKSMGTRAFLAVDPRVGSAEEMIGLVNGSGVATVSFPVTGEPTTGSVTEAVRTALAQKCDMAVGIGGGSALDTAKAVAALLTNASGLMEYLEVVGRGRPLSLPAAPWMAVPTTAGTGAEATGNAVLASVEHRVKVSLRHPSMLPRLALIDPELTLSVPPDVTASSGLDALTQLIEPFVCNQSNAMVDVLCREGIAMAGTSLLRAYQNGKDLQARQDMSLAALYSGSALANAGLGAVHGMAGPLGGVVSIPHGTACARLLPCVMEMNVKVLRNRLPDSPALVRYHETARLFCGNPKASIDDGIETIRILVKTMQVPRLSSFGFSRASFPELIEKAKKASSMKGNPVLLTDGELMEILEMEGKY
jgi:alcohol dehydrogenase class IV